MFKPRFIRSTYPPPDKFIVIPRIFVRKEEEKKLSVVSKNINFGVVMKKNILNTYLKRCVRIVGLFLVVIFGNWISL